MKTLFSFVVLTIFCNNIGICQVEKYLDVPNLVSKENSTCTHDNENYIYSYTIAIEHTGIYTKNFIKNIVFRFRIYHNNEEVYSKVKSLNVNLMPGDLDWFTINIGKRFPFFVGCDNCTQNSIEFLYTN